MTRFVVLDKMQIPHTGATKAEAAAKAVEANRAYGNQ